MEIRQLIEVKGSDVVSVSPQTSVREATKILRQKNVGCVIVLDDHKKIKGIVSERDIVSCIADRGGELIDKPVTEIMSSDMFVCDTDSALEALVVDVTENRIRHLPVMDGDLLVGVVSVGDLLKLRLAQAEYGTSGRLSSLFQKKGVRAL